MQDIASKKPAVASRRHIESTRLDRRTLREHYREKKLRYADDYPDFFDTDLFKLFSADARFADQPTAASFLRKLRPELRETVARWTGAYAYTIDQVLRDMIDRCKELKLRLAIQPNRARTEAMMMVAVRTTHYMLGGHHPVVL
jgi:hypothetical protein